MTTSHPVPFKLLAGHPVLDFVNTVGGARLVDPKEKLNRYGDLLAWGVQTGMLTAAEGKQLGREAAGRPAETAHALERVRDLRERTYRLFLARAEGRPPAAEDLAELDAEVHRAWTRRRLQPTAEGVAWAVQAALDLDALVPRLALAAAELLTSSELSRMRICEDTDGCGWLFLDRTRNHSRRWCEMESCGNKHKARRHYARVRGKA